MHVKTLGFLTKQNSRVRRQPTASDYNTYYTTVTRRMGRWFPIASLSILLFIFFSIINTFDYGKNCLCKHEFTYSARANPNRNTTCRYKTLTETKTNTIEFKKKPGTETNDNRFIKGV